MRTALILEDTPDGLKTKLVWQVNGYQDHLADSIAMHLMAQFTETIRQMERSKALRVVNESKRPPSAEPEAVT